MNLFFKKENILNRFYFFGGIGLVIIYNSHYLYYGQDSVFYANDYLELVVPWFRHLVESGAVFEPNRYLISGMLSEMPRGLFPSEFYFETWLFLFFEPFHAVLINKILIHLIAFTSAFHFISSLAFNIKNYRILLFSICWSSVGFWAGSGIGAAAMPSMIYVFYILFNGGYLKLKYLLFLVFYSFYSYLHLHGLFLLISVFLIGLWGIVKKNNVKSYFFGFIGLLSCSILFNYRLIDIYFFQREWFIPHRIQYDIYSFGAYHDAFLKNFLNLLSVGAVHSISVSPLLFVFACALFYNPGSYASDNFRKMAKISLLAAVLLAAISMAIKYLPLIEAFPVLNLFSEFSYERFSYFVAPLTFFSFLILAERSVINRYIADAMIVLIILYNVFVINENLRNKVVKPTFGLGEVYATFEEFYSTKLFEEVKNIFQKNTDQKDYKVASLGIHPGVAIYNGVPSIDGYAGIYNLSYKVKIFNVIKDEIEESDLYEHFVGWGNKCYLYNSEQMDDFLRWKWKQRILINPAYNYDQLRSLGCDFLISTDPILNNSELKFLDVVEDAESAWILYLYKIRDSDC